MKVEIVIFHVKIEDIPVLLILTRDEQAYLQSNKNTIFCNKNLFTKDRKDRKKDYTISVT